jgi:hypothetical protein
MESKHKMIAAIALGAVAFVLGAVGLALSSEQGTAQTTTTIADEIVPVAQAPSCAATCGGGCGGNCGGGCGCGCGGK